MAQVKINKISSLVHVIETPTHVKVQRNSPTIIEVTAPGPQGASFTGESYFNNTAIGNLNTGNAGAVLEWDGALFQPTQLLENDLQINGGAF